MSGVKNVQNKVGPLEDSAGNIISQGFFNAGRPKWLLQSDLKYELITIYCFCFSSVFTRENVSTLPVPYVKFQEAKSDYLGQLIVTPEM